MDRNKRYTAKKKADEEEEARQRKVLEQLKLTGRIPTHRPGHFHDTGKKQRQRRDRHAEKRRLKDVCNQTEEY